LKFPLSPRYTKILLLGFALIGTIIVILYPIKLQLIYNSISSQLIFTNLPLFMVIYSVWLIYIVLLLFYIKAKMARAFLLCLFSLVFLGFWIIAAPLGGTADSPWIMGHVNYILANGNINPSNQYLSYFNFPSLPILGTFLSLSMSINVFSMSLFYLIFSCLFFTCTLFMYSRIF
jgi:hypothetical protein